MVAQLINLLEWVHTVSQVIFKVPRRRDLKFESDVWLLWVNVTVTVDAALRCVISVRRTSVVIKAKRVLSLLPYIEINHLLPMLCDVLLRPHWLKLEFKAHVWIFILQRLLVWHLSHLLLIVWQCGLGKVKRKPDWLGCVLLLFMRYCPLLHFY